MDDLLELLTASWDCELLWNTWCCCEASKWVLRLTRGVCSWDWMSNQEGGWDEISTGHVQRIRKEDVWMFPSSLGIPVFPIFHYSCENQVSWYLVLYPASGCEIHNWSVPHASRNFPHAEVQCFSLLLLEFSWLIHGIAWTKWSTSWCSCSY